MKGCRDALRYQRSRRDAALLEWKVKDRCRGCSARKASTQVGARAWRRRQAGGTWRPARGREGGPPPAAPAVPPDAAAPAAPAAPAAAPATPTAAAVPDVAAPAAPYAAAAPDAAAPAPPTLAAPAPAPAGAPAAAPPADAAWPRTTRSSCSSGTKFQSPATRQGPGREANGLMCWLRKACCPTLSLGR